MFTAAAQWYFLEMKFFYFLLNFAVIISTQLNLRDVSTHIFVLLFQFWTKWTKSPHKLKAWVCLSVLTKFFWCWGEFCVCNSSRIEIFSEAEVNLVSASLHEIGILCVVEVKLEFFEVRLLCVALQKIEIFSHAEVSLLCATPHEIEILCVTEVSFFVCAPQ